MFKKKNKNKFKEEPFEMPAIVIGLAISAMFFGIMVVWAAVIIALQHGVA